MNEMNKASNLTFGMSGARSRVQEDDARPKKANVIRHLPSVLHDVSPEVEKLATEQFVGVILVIADLIDSISGEVFIARELGDDLSCLSHCLRRTVTEAK